MTILISAGVLYFRFLFRLQRKFRLSFFISSGIFVTGTVVLESIGAAVWNGALEAFPLGQTWPRMILYEELLEMLGIILLIHTLLCIVALDESPYRAAV